MGLKEYVEKRNFSKTSEPKGKITTKNKKRFVIQYHQARAKHYDFRFEHNGVLISFAVPKGLSFNPKEKHLAVHVEDHPIEYISFQGIIPKGNYGAGSVEIYDTGTFTPIEDLDKGLEKGHIKLFLNGKKCKGGWSLIKTDEKNWLIVKLKDEYVNLTKKDTRLPFKQCSCQLATLSSTIPTGKNWLYEIKYDGYRILTFYENNNLKMFTRNGVDYSKKLNNIANCLLKLRHESFVLDGEVVAFDENGRTDFSLLQQSLKTNKPLNYVIFDILALNGEDLRPLPLIERKKKLELLLANSDKTLIYSNHVINKGKQCLKFAKQNNLEGIIAKDMFSPYVSKRTDKWLKIKCYLRQEFVICGYTTTSKNPNLSALILGYYKNRKLVYVGKVGTGFREETKSNLLKDFEKLKTNEPPFNSALKNANWLKPKLVAEVQFAELTKDKILRQPSFISLRKDKDAKDVKLEVKA